VDIKKQYNRLVDDTLEYLTTGFAHRWREQTPEERSELIEENAGDDGRPVVPSARVQENSAHPRFLQLDGVNAEVLDCTKCPLHQERRNAVPGRGPVDAEVMFIGEGPGEMEDIQGEPFVGKAGQLLTKMLSAIQLKREEVYITNVVKCRPPGNRTPLPEEVATCFPYLERQIEIIGPLIICCLGGPAANAILGSDSGISKLRGTIHLFRDIPVIPTYHPAAVLRFPEKYKRLVWNDLKMLRDYYRDIKK